MRWNSQKERVVLTLTTKVSLLSLAQIVEAFWSSERQRTAEQSLTALVTEGYLARKSVLVHPELSLTERVCAWTPGEPPPSFFAASYQCRKRWNKDLTSRTVWYATPKAMTEFGGYGKGGLPKIGQISHELHVAALYCRLLQNDPKKAAMWIPEKAILNEREERAPDAIFRDETGNSVQALEFGGACRPARVEKLHRFCEAFQLPYELW